MEVAGTSIDRQYKLNNIRNRMQNRCREEYEIAWNRMKDTIYRKGPKAILERH